MPANLERDVDVNTHGHLQVIPPPFRSGFFVLCPFTPRISTELTKPPKKWLLYSISVSDPPAFDRR